MSATRAFSMILAMVLILLTVGLVGCGGGGGGDNLITVTGRVIDDGTLVGVVGARVVGPGGVQVTTTADGLFTFPGLSNSVASLTIVASNYLNAVVTVPVGTGDRGVGVVNLQPAPVAGAGNITGVVLEAGSPVADAVLQAAGHQAVSKTDGTFTIYNVPAGLQTLLARSASGLKAASQTVSVPDGSSVSTTVRLTSSPPDPPPLT